MLNRLISFISDVAVNMAFRFRFAVAAVICLILHFFCGLTLKAFLIVTAAWIIYSIIVTLFMKAVINSDSIPDDRRSHSQKARDND